MGAGNFNVTEYKIQATEATTSENLGFQTKFMCDEFNPAKVNTRFSKKSPFNEFRDPITILIGLDVTGSMDVIPKILLTGSLGSLMVDLQKTFNRPNENLQISFAGIGDAKTDKAPLQVTHFESDNRFSQQLQKIWLEGGGGGNGGESYNLLWWYAANKTHLNYVQQDRRKGILITIGDDKVHPDLIANEIQAWLDPKYEGGNISNKVLLNSVQEQYEVYHIVVKDGSAYRHNDTAKQWAELLGSNNVIQIKSDSVHLAIAEIVKRHRPDQKESMTDLKGEVWSTENKNNLTDKQWQEVLSYTLCPLTHQFMKHPVVWGDSKRAYEREAVIKYVQDHQKDPSTHKKLNPVDLILKPNLNIAQLCLNYETAFTQLPEKRRNQLIEMTLPSSENSSHNFLAFFPGPEKIPFAQSEQKGRISLNMELDLECPIFHTIMTDPVMLVETGHTFEREAIEGWLSKHDTDPLGSIVLKNKSLVPNLVVKSLCEEALKNQNQMKTL